MLKTRLITSAIALPLVLLAVWFDSPLPWFTVAAGLMALLGAMEFFRLTGVREVVPVTVFGLVFTLLLTVSPHFGYRFSIPLILGAGALVSFIITVWTDIRPGRFIRWSWMLVGSVYIGWLLSLLVEVRLVPGLFESVYLGRNLVFAALVITFASDTFAYTVGRTIGRHKMAPFISPRKTWEGAAGGIAGALLAGWLFTLDWALFIPFSLWQALLLGAMVSVFGQLGDLAESAIKRFAGAKDSGTLMPGHGGALDRIDSILPASAVIYVFYVLIFA